MSKVEVPEVHVPTTPELAEIEVRVQQRLSRASSEIIAIGLDLLLAKELVAHGEFGSWIEERVGVSHRLANMFMVAARRFGGEVATVASLPGGVLLELAAPSVPDELVDAVLQGRVEPTVVAVRDQIGKGRQRSVARRVGRTLAESLWDLPDKPVEAGEVVAAAVWREAEADDTNTFLSWFVAAFSEALDLLADESES